MKKTVARVLVDTLAALHVRDPADVPSALTEAFEHKGPALVEVDVNRQELSMPPAITIEQAKGFSLYMAKAVTNGRGDEIVDLAATNLWR